MLQKSYFWILDLGKLSIPHSTFYGLLGTGHLSREGGGGATTREGGGVKFYPIKKGDGKGFNYAEGGGGTKSFEVF